MSLYLIYLYDKVLYLYFYSPQYARYLMDNCYEDKSYTITLSANLCAQQIMAASSWTNSRGGDRTHDPQVVRRAHYHRARAPQISLYLIYLYDKVLYLYFVYNLSRDHIIICPITRDLNIFKVYISLVKCDQSVICKLEKICFG